MFSSDISYVCQFSNSKIFVFTLLKNIPSMKLYTATGRNNWHSKIFDNTKYYLLFGPLHETHMWLNFKSQKYGKKFLLEVKLEKESARPGARAKWKWVINSPNWAGFTRPGGCSYYFTVARARPGGPAGGDQKTYFCTAWLPRDSFRNSFFNCCLRNLFCLIMLSIRACLDWA